MTALAEAFARARAEERAALIGYLPAGFPNRDDSVRLMRAMVEAGVDIVEVGLPYSDPLMDGPVIQAAADQALRAGTTPADVISIAGDVAQTGAATVVMSYWNPVERFGVDAFARDLAAAGGCGVITPHPPAAARSRAKASTPNLSTGFQYDMTTVAAPVLATSPAMAMTSAGVVPPRKAWSAAAWITGPSINGSE